MPFGPGPLVGAILGLVRVSVASSKQRAATVNATSQRYHIRTALKQTIAEKEAKAVNRREARLLEANAAASCLTAANFFGSLLARCVGGLTSLAALSCLAPTILHQSQGRDTDTHRVLQQAISGQQQKTPSHHKPKWQPPYPC